MSEHARWNGFVQLCLSRLREVYREPEVIFWGFVFPVLLSVSLFFAFRNRPPDPSMVAVVEGPGAAEMAAQLGARADLKVAVRTEEDARAALTFTKADVVVVPPAEAGGAVEYRLDPSRPEAAIARARVDDALQRSAGRQDPLATREQAVTEPGGRYIDFLVPGLIGMNLMSGGMWGLGFTMVDMRIKRLLKRLIATPMHKTDLLAAHLLMRNAFTAFEVSFLLAFAHFFFSVPVRGSWLAVLLTAALGAMAFAGLGLLVGSRTRKIETVTGLMNVVMVPMFIGSGVFFSTDRFPAVLQPVLRALPLTALNDALRAIVLEGADLGSQGVRLAVLAGWALFGFVLGLKLFRWS
jgi:ABC-type multidrug transport system permease subunit